ncbi:hypothetical protein [Rhizobacter sp. Root1221]|uniref:IS66 family transposase n=1 Tax=Rhizobacter sp. Root1221 TaxID=1736433 RepID=UPI0006F429EB|nr:hypothetical protein [Rhizobacter sp. Root1221]KQW00163.1 hypothetical protein ASC87_19325 [Rhizobacter sp. Root1221]
MGFVFAIASLARSRPCTLTFEMAQLKRMKFGKRSELLDSGPRALFREAVDAGIGRPSAAPFWCEPVNPAPRSHLSRDVATAPGAGGQGAVPE